MSSPLCVLHAKKIWLTLLIAAAMAAGIFIWRGEIAAQYWRWQLERQPDARTADILGRLRGLGDLGTPVLAEAIGSCRDCVALGAEESLRQQVQRWPGLPDSEAVPKLTLLAKSLAEYAVHFGPSAKVVAADLAETILRQLAERRNVDRTAALAACDRVLETTAVERSLLSARLAGEPQSGDAPASDEPGESPPEDFAASVEPSGLAYPGDTPSHLLEAPVSGRVADLKDLGISLQRPSTAFGPAEDRTDHAAPGTSASSGPELQAVPPPGGAPAAKAEGEPRGKVSNEDLMRRLHAQDSIAAEARAELRRRGLTEVELELARQLFDPDPAVRRELARRLPEVRTVDAMPWLLRLADDPDPEVRNLATALIATTGDPQAALSVRQRAQRDPDPQIQSQADRISERPLNSEPATRVR